MQRKAKRISERTANAGAAPRGAAGATLGRRSALGAQGTGLISGLAVRILKNQRRGRFASGEASPIEHEHETGIDTALKTRNRAAEAARRCSTPSTCADAAAASPEETLSEQRKRNRLLIVLAALGPGIVTAMAGNDAGGISTYSTAGAQFGYATLWVIPIMCVLLAVVELTASRMGAVTGKGFAALIRELSLIHI